MIKLKQTPEQVELLRAIASKNKTESLNAAEMFAAAASPVIGTVLSQLGTASLFYEDFPIGEDESPTFPLDDFYGESAGYINVWYMPGVAGGLPSSRLEGSGEMPLTTYELESAFHFKKDYARKTSAFNVLQRGMARMINEILVKQDRQAWACILRALAEASSDGTSHIISATTAGRLQLNDFNRLLTLNKRINKSYANGTPDMMFTNGITDLVVSAELKEDIRGFAYQPMNTIATPNTNQSTVLPLPDSIREEIYRSAGSSSIYGINISDVYELGVGQKYNILFAKYKTSGFTQATQQIAVGVNASKGGLLRPVRTDGVGGTAEMLVDDVFTARSKDVGFYTQIREGRTVLDSRVLNGLIV